MERITDPLGNVVNEVKYDEDGRFVGVVDALGNEVAQEYNIENNTFIQTDRNGNPTTVEYDDRGNVTREVDALGGETLYEYGDSRHAHLETAITDANGNSTRFEFDARGNVTLLEEPGGVFTRFEYNSFNNITRTIGPATSLSDESRVSHNLYDENGNLIENIDVFGISSLQTNDQFGRPLTVTDRRGYTTEFEYDQFISLPTKTIDPSGNTVENQYNANGQVLYEKNELGIVTTATYDAVGNRLTETNGLNEVTTATFDELSNLTSLTDPLGESFEIEYDVVGRQSALVDPEGFKTDYHYDPNGNQVRIVDTRGGVKEYEFDALNRETAFTNENGFTSRTEYDSVAGVTARVDALGNSEIYERNERGQRTKVSTERTDADGNVIEVAVLNTYNGLGELIQTVDPSGGTTSFTRRIDGTIDTIIDPRGLESVYSYNENGDVTKTVYSDGTVSVLEYDFRGNTTRVLERQGDTNLTTYDAAGRIVGRANSAGRDVEYSFDDANRFDSVTTAGVSVDLETSPGFVFNPRTTALDQVTPRITKVTFADGSEANLTYNASGQLASAIDPSGGLTEYEFGAEGVPESISADGIVAGDRDFDLVGGLVGNSSFTTGDLSYTNDANGRVVQVEDALGGVTRYQYDEIGNRTVQEDANGNVTKWQYDNGGRITSRILPLGQEETFTYSVAGDLLSYIDFNGNETTYSYDLNGQVLSTSFADGSESNFTYDSNGRLDSFSNTTGTTSLSYDSDDRLSRVDQPGNLFIEYRYDSESRFTSIETNFGTTRYTYSLLGQIETVTDSSGRLTSYSTDLAAGTVTTNFSNGFSSQRTATGDTETIRYFNPDETLFSSYEDSTDEALGQRVVNESNGRQVTYSFDLLHRLTRETVEVNGIVENDTFYTYDSVSNRLSKADGTGITTYSYNANNQLVSEVSSAGTTLYSYDLNGNLLEKVTPSGTTVFEYDLENQLVGVVDSEGGGTTYQYDAQGNRISKTVDGFTTHFLIDTTYENDRVVADVDASGGLLVQYTYGREIISQLSADTGYAILGDDTSNSVRFLVDDTATLVGQTTYDSFGVTIDTSGISSRFQYVGEALDRETGNYYLRARYLDANTGTFTARDPFQGNLSSPASQNGYNYANANPITFVDPSGRAAVIEYAVQLVSIAGRSIDSIAAFGGGFAAAFGAFGVAVLGASLISGGNGADSLVFGFSGSGGIQRGTLELGAGANTSRITSFENSASPARGSTFGPNFDFISTSQGLYAALVIPGIPIKGNASVEGLGGYGYNITDETGFGNLLPSSSLGTTFTGAISVIGLTLTSVTTFVNSPAVIVAAGISDGYLDALGGADPEFRVTFAQF